jgi:hypothetical protein
MVAVEDVAVSEVRLEAVLIALSVEGEDVVDAVALIPIKPPLCLPALVCPCSLNK